MAMLDINMIRDFLISVGSKIEYPILVKSFKQHLYNPDPDVQGRIRTQFKDYVNRLATVSVENNMKFIILRPEFRPPEGSPAVHNHIHPQPNESKEAKQQEQLHPQPVVQANHQPENQAKIMVTKPQTFQQSQQPVMFSPPNPSTRGPSLNQQQHALPPPVPQHQSGPAEFSQRSGQPVTVTSMRMNHQDNFANRRPANNISQPFVSPNAHQPQQPLSPTVTKTTTMRYQPPAQDQAPQSYQSPPSQSPRAKQYPPTRPLVAIQQQQVSPGDYRPSHDCVDTNGTLMRAPPAPLVHRRTQSLQQEQSPVQHQRPESLNLSSASVNDSQQMPPPRPPPRRRQSTASLFNKPSMSSSKPIEKMSREVHEIARKSLVGRVREHALKFNSSTSSNDLSALMPKRNPSMKENRLSRDSALGSLSSALQRNGSHITNRSRSSHREDESDSSSLQPIDPMRRKWAIEACNCNYNGLLTLLREEPKLASYKDMVNGYTALHWAAKFGNLDIIKLIAGTHQVSVNIKSSAGHTPLHVAYIFNRHEAASLLLTTYKANSDIRDHSGKKPLQYLNKKKMKTNEN